MLLTHTSIHGQMSFTQPQGVTLRGVPIPEGALHIYTPRRSTLEDPGFKVWDWSL